MAMVTMGPGMVGVVEFTIHEGDSVLQPKMVTAYLHGADNLCQAFEAHLDGTGAGDTFDVVVPEAFGPGGVSEPIAVPRKEFRNRGAHLKKGQPVQVEGSDGKVMRLWITDIRGSRVFVNPEHPWAGRALRFEGRLLIVRPASETEVAHRHAHGVGGQDH